MFPSCQATCYSLISILRDQPEAVLRSYWARHWACAVDVLELLSTEAALRPDGDLHGSSESAEKAFGSVKGELVLLISEQYKPGGQYRRNLIYFSHNRYTSQYISVVDGKPRSRFIDERILYFLQGMATKPPTWTSA